MYEMRPRSTEELQVIDALLAAADAILTDAGIHWNADRERYESMKRAIIEAADTYHTTMREVEAKA